MVAGSGVAIGMFAACETFMQDFHRVEAWRRAHALAIELDKASREFGKHGYAHLRTQLVRASDSVPANIVEGCGAASKRDFARFLDVSITSATEAEYHLLSARDRGLIPELAWQRHSGEAIQIPEDAARVP